ncbi:acyl-CoA dehydrogenase [Citricoccus sp. SGAir0253]|uniref:acyl-CoA dehydrogenase family protein n=1 Tax=Citricoccus sp. SGAir0253 TaxID=2567881 RepID=UPI0010CCCB74|nr:acyl-CoA dehydrogenase family protein [Citricoccus sp. SGAir0253]QCU78868.1 acyl-CoA dehydrogenase [Citricoccus sp. SGAir0253]
MTLTHDPAATTPTAGTTATATDPAQDAAAQAARLAAVRERLAPVFASIAESAAEREAGRIIDRDAVRRLAEAGFTSLRVPVEYGGSGLTFAQSAGLIVELAAADSNLTQALRAHLINQENVLGHPDPAFRDRWLRRLGEGAVVGNAVTEIDNAVGEGTTRLVQDAGGTWRLNGTKYYSTGSLYADWIIVAAVDAHGEEIAATVPVDAPGVTLLDDWDGFGQQLTASGTTVFEDTPVDPAEVYRGGLDDGTRVATGQASWQFLHLASLTGIAQAVVRDSAAYVRGRRRSFSHGVTELPRDDAQVLQVIGEVSASAFAVRAAFDAVVAALGDVLEREAAGEALPEEDVNALYIRVYQAQQVIAKTVLEAATRWFEVGGASATSSAKRFDRHWRNARVLANHNPLIYRARYIGDWEVNGTPPGRAYRIGSA